MHKELKAFFDEHANPTHASLDDIGARAGDIVGFIAVVQHQVLEYETLLHQAEYAPHDPGLDGKLESIHQTLGNAKMQVQELTALLHAVRRAARETRKTFAQMERYGKEWLKDIAAYESAQ